MYDMCDSLIRWVSLGLGLTTRVIGNNTIYMQSHGYCISVDCTATAVHTINRTELLSALTPVPSGTRRSTKSFSITRERTESVRRERGSKGRPPYSYKLEISLKGRRALLARFPEPHYHFVISIHLSITNRSSFKLSPFTFPYVWGSDYSSSVPPWGRTETPATQIPVLCHPRLGSSVLPL